MDQYKSPPVGRCAFHWSSCKISFSESLICQKVILNQDQVKIQNKKPNKGEILYVLCAQSEVATKLGSPDQPKQKYGMNFAMHKIMLAKMLNPIED